MGYVLAPKQLTWSEANKRYGLDRVLTAFYKKYPNGDLNTETWHQLSEFYGTEIIGDDEQAKHEAYVERMKERREYQYEKGDWLT